MKTSNGLIYCNDYGDNPDCLGQVDERFTMDYTDVEGGSKIHWCSHCGPLAEHMVAAISEACRTRPGFIEKFEKEIAKAVEEQNKQAN